VQERGNQGVIWGDSPVFRAIVTDASDTSPHAAAPPLRCPLCEYELTGLTEPRCPECGYAFDWAELRRAAAEERPWFIEHARRGVVWAAVKTFGRALWPAGFWSQLNAGHRGKAGRLAGFAMLLVGVIAGTAVACLTSDIGAAYGPYRLAFGRVVVGTPGPLTPFQFAWRYLWGDGAVTWRPTLFVAAWPLVTTGAAMVFGQTMRRARVRPLHVTRVAIYGFAPAVAVWVVVLALMAIDGRDGERWYAESTRSSVGTAWAGDALGISPRLLLAIVIAWAAMTASVVAAYERYLRFPNPIATAMLVQVVGLLWVLAGLSAMRETLGP